MDGQNSLPFPSTAGRALKPLHPGWKIAAITAVFFATLPILSAERPARAEAMGQVSVDVVEPTAKQISPEAPPSPVLLAAKTDSTSSAAIDPSPTTPGASVKSAPALEKPVVETTPAPLPSNTNPVATPTTHSNWSDVIEAAKPTPAANDIESAPIRGTQNPASALAPMAPASTASTTTTPPMIPSGVMSALQVAAALTVVVGLIFIGKALAKKFVPGAKASNGKGVIEVLARYPLCKNQMLVLVRIGSQIVTLNQTKDASQSVLVISDATEVAKIMGQIEGQSPHSIQAGFTKLLANARMDLEDPVNSPDRSDFELRSMEPENLDSQLDEMAAAKRQLMELRQQVRSVRDSLPRG